MDSVSQDTPKTKLGSKGGPLVLALGCYLLSAGLHVVLILLSEIPVIHVAFLRLAWRLGPWSSLPFPYNFTEHASQPSLDINDIPTVVVVSVAMFLGLTLVVGVLHGFSFAVVVAMHIQLGRPRYWPDVRQKLDLQSIWALHARRSWWVWPLVQLTWLLLDQVSWGFVYAFYPIINTGPFYQFLNILGVVIMYGIVGNRLVRTSVVGAVDYDDLRCRNCDYLLRGIDEGYCPECGRERNGIDAVEYRVLGQRPGWARRTRRLVPFAAVVVLLSAPVWLPIGLTCLPRNWLRFIPAAVRPDEQILYFDTDTFPIRFGSICVVRHKGSVAIIRFQKKEAYRAGYRVSYWSDANDCRPSNPSDLESVGQVTMGGGPKLPVGPWEFYYSFCEDMVLVTRPAESYSVEVFVRSDLPAQLRWLEQNEGAEADIHKSGELGRSDLEKVSG